MARYQGDPRWMTTRFNSTCADCGAAIPRGAGAYYYPNGKRFYGRDCGCGQEHAADFEACSFDEDVLG